MPFFYFGFLLFGVIIGGSIRFLVGGDYCQNKYNFINQKLACDNEYAIDKSEYIELKNSISSFLEQKIADKSILKATVYFRDLQNGPTFGINEKELFIGASLIKLPVLIAYLNIAEENRDFLFRKLGYKPDGKKKLIQIFKPKETLESGKIYTIEELLNKMIVYSDNNSFDLLEDYLAYYSPKENLLLQTYQELGIIEPKGSLEESLSIKSYASVFRILFNSSYLSKEMSEKALQLLSITESPNTIRAGVPDGITVAHKFGERTVIYTDGQIKKQFHDCGIIYFPKNPYLLCVMTKGEDYDKLISVIGEISKMVWEEFKSREK